ncbi:MAG: glycosyltransferase family 2 protein, partial [Gammaproteobacteria bacterium]
RFFSLENIATMPRYRIIGNVVMSFVSKFSSGYWNVFDPANGFIAIHASALRVLPLDRISDDYFFESDMLFRLNTLRAVVIDVPMHAQYGDEQSHLDVFASLPVFIGKHIGNFAKRIFYSYFLRNFSVASIQWVIGPLLLLFGVVFGVHAWRVAEAAGLAATAGTVMLAALPIIVGLQFILAAIDYDVRSVPTVPLHRLLSKHLLNDHP